jgi:hypothetical protein
MTNQSPEGRWEFAVPQTIFEASGFGSLDARQL